MASVKLVKSYRNYNPDELADFGEELNQRLIDAGVAEEAPKKDEKKEK